MAIVGYFSNVTEMNRLVQSKLLPGVVEEIFEVGQLLPLMPVTTIDSYSLKWNQEKTLPSVSAKGKGEQYGWKEIADFTPVELFLKEYGDQWALPKVVQDTYKNPNDYRGVMMTQIVKGALRTIEDQVIYGSVVGNAKTFNGLDKLCPAAGAEAFGTSQAYDMGGATVGLTIAVLLKLLRQCKPRPSILLMTGAMQDALFVYSMGKAGAIVMARQPNEFGKMISSVNGVPIVVSDFLSTENDNTGGDLGTGNLVSVYAIRFGPTQDGGVSLCVGGKTGGKDFFETDFFTKLEGYNAEGIRAYCYAALAQGSTKAVARVHSIDQTVAIA